MKLTKENLEQAPDGEYVFFGDGKVIFVGKKKGDRLIVGVFSYSIYDKSDATDFFPASAIQMPKEEGVPGRDGLHGLTGLSFMYDADKFYKLEQRVEKLENADKAKFLHWLNSGEIKVVSEPVQKNPERIMCAAIRFSDMFLQREHKEKHGFVIGCIDYDSCFSPPEAAHYYTVKGFLTTKNRFVDAKEAWDIHMESKGILTLQDRELKPSELL